MIFVYYKTQFGPWELRIYRLDEEDAREDATFYNQIETIYFFAELTTEGF